MYFRTCIPLIVLLATVPVAGLSQTAQPSALPKLAANAGTGPYEDALQAGLTNDPLRTQLNIHATHLTVSLRDFELELKSVGDRNRAQELRGELDGLKVNLKNFLRTYAPRHFTDPVDHLVEKVDKYLSGIQDPSSTNGPPGPTKAQMQANYEARESIGALIGLASDIAYEPVAVQKPVALKAGVFFGSGNTYQFNALSASFGQFGHIGERFASFVTLSELNSLSSSKFGVSGRVGLGAAFGDPDHLFSTVGAATYLSPFALDSEVSFSFRGQVPRPKGLTKNSVAEIEQLTKRRTLLDHVRPGDTWFSFQARSISNSGSSLLANGFIGEGSMTFAFPTRYGSEFRSTTLTLSGIYCAQRELGVDELGAELRTPISNSARHPVYFSARYGTRGHYTLALESRL